jgi:clan AA aspartic protease (TIGR02281 family)
MLSDRDYMYEPKEFRGKSHPQIKRPGKKNNFNKLFIFLFVIGCAYLLLKYRYEHNHEFKLMVDDLNKKTSPVKEYNNVSNQTQNPNQSNNFLAQSPCEPIPPSNQIRIYDQSIENNNSKNRLLITSDLTSQTPSFFVLKDFKTNKVLLMAPVMSNNPFEYPLPPMKFGVDILQGNNWCNDKIGFLDGAINNLVGGIEINSEFNHFNLSASAENKLTFTRINNQVVNQNYTSRTIPPLNQDQINTVLNKRFQYPKNQRTETYQNCAAIPNESIIFDFNKMQRDDSNGKIELTNNTNGYLVVLLSDISTGKKLEAFPVGPGKSLIEKIPSGTYEEKVYLGHQWCNFEVGFKQGLHSNVIGGLSLSPNTINKRVYSVDQSQHITINQDSESDGGIIKNGILTINQFNSHYYTKGSINGLPVKFMIDTGATYSSISSNTAAKLGITQCNKTVQMQTGNGLTTGCLLKVAELNFGSFLIKNAEVVVLPNLATDSLLGMNVLNKFNLSTNGNKLLIQ